MDATGGAAFQVTLLIPACDEEPVIGATLRALTPGQFAQVLVAVNGSEDRTAACAVAAGAEVIEVAERGYGAACLAALPLIRGGVVLFLQADGSEDTSEADSVLQPIYRDEADMVLGSRTAGLAAPGSLLPHQRFGNWLATTLIRLRWGHRYSDLGPFRAIRTNALRGLGMQERNYGWTVEMQIRALQAGLRVVEVPVRYAQRRAGVNKVSGHFLNSFRAGWVILRTVARLAATGRSTHSPIQRRW